MTDKKKIIAYIDKLLEKYPKNYYLLTVAEFIDSLQEEPVSEELEKIVEEITEPTILNAYGTKELARRLRNTVIYGTSASEELEEAVNAYIGYAPEVDESSSVYGKRQAFKAGAKWQKEKDNEEKVLTYKHGFEDCKEQLIKDAINEIARHDDNEIL